MTDEDAGLFILSFINGIIVFFLSLALFHMYALHNGIEYMNFEEIVDMYYGLAIWTSVTLGYISARITAFVKEIL